NLALLRLHLEPIDDLDAAMAAIDREVEAISRERDHVRCWWKWSISLGTATARAELPRSSVREPRVLARFFWAAGARGRRWRAARTTTAGAVATQKEYVNISTPLLQIMLIGRLGASRPLGGR